MIVNLQAALIERALLAHHISGKRPAKPKGLDVCYTEGDDVIERPRHKEQDEREREEQRPTLVHALRLQHVTACSGGVNLRGGGRGALSHVHVHYIAIQTLCLAQL